MRGPISRPRLEALGYAKAKDLIAYDVDAVGTLAGSDPEDDRARAGDARACGSGRST